LNKGCTFNATHRALSQEHLAQDVVLVSLCDARPLPVRRECAESMEEQIKGIEGKD
jgi:hypothetical protein